MSKSHLYETIHSERASLEYARIRNHKAQNPKAYAPTGRGFFAVWILAAVLVGAMLWMI